MSKTDGRVGKTTNMIIGGTVADDSAKDWLELDQKVSHADIFFLFGRFPVELLFLSRSKSYMLVFIKPL